MAKAVWQALLCLIMIALMTQEFASAQVDRTRQPRTAGSDVVFASVARIQNSGIFPDDNRFLRRVAYVETRDGVDINTYREGYFGGIWQVDEDTFSKTQNIADYPALLDIYIKIISEFGINWSATTWEDLLAPFYSALAARIYFITINYYITGEAIPPIGDLQAQGEYWLWYYTRDLSASVQTFIDGVNKFEMEECPIRGIDLAFVFDSSGSVGRANFEREKEFAVDVTNTFTIGPDDTRIANIAYSGFANISFFFNTHKNKSSVVNALRQVEYFSVANPPGSRRGTYTADALFRLRTEVFNVENGARESRFGIPRVAVVITDGRSNVNRSETIPAAEALHDDGVIVFAVGVGSRINMAELQAIGSAPEFVLLLNSFDIMEFANLQRRISAEACIVPAPIEINEEIEGVLEDPGDLSFFQFQVPTSGMTLRLQGQSGRTVMYASDKIQNPNSAFYDYRYDSRDDRGGLFVSADILSGDSGNRGRRTVTNGNFTNSTLYVTIEGLQEQNLFSLYTTFGDTSSSNTEPTSGLTTVTSDGDISSSNKLTSGLTTVTVLLIALIVLL